MPTLFQCQISTLIQFPYPIKLQPNVDVAWTLKCQRCSNVRFQRWFNFHIQWNYNQISTLFERWNANGVPMSDFNVDSLFISNEIATKFQRCLNVEMPTLFQCQMSTLIQFPYPIKLQPNFDVVVLTKFQHKVQISMLMFQPNSTVIFPHTVSHRLSLSEIYQNQQTILFTLDPTCIAFHIPQSHLSSTMHRKWRLMNL